MAAKRNKRIVLGVPLTMESTRSHTEKIAALDALGSVHIIRDPRALTPLQAAHLRLLLARNYANGAIDDFVVTKSDAEAKAETEKDDDEDETTSEPLGTFVDGIQAWTLVRTVDGRVLSSFVWRWRSLSDTQSTAVSVDFNPSLFAEACERGQRVAEALFVTTLEHVRRLGLATGLVRTWLKTVKDGGAVAAAVSSIGYTENGEAITGVKSPHYGILFWNSVGFLALPPPTLPLPSAKERFLCAKDVDMTAHEFMDQVRSTVVPFNDTRPHLLMLKAPTALHLSSYGCSSDMLARDLETKQAVVIN